MPDSFYRAFEDKHRGSRELIKSRLKVYLPFVTPFLKQKAVSSHRALDLGCGRGEWLELLTEQGFIAQGVDLDEGMLETCWKNKLQAERTDALDYLEGQKSKSIAVISGFHIAEHLPFVKLQDLVRQALRVLKPGGILILETPNPENIVVGTANFYVDPTHQRPLPPSLLSFVAEYAGYERIKVLRLQEPEGLLESGRLSLLDVLSGVSPDYSVIAQKKAPEKLIKNFDAAFLKDYGLSLNKVATCYEEQLATELIELKEQQVRIHAHTEWLQNEWDTTKQKLESLNHQVGALETALSTEREDKLKEADRLKKELQAVYDSKSWRITWPLRKLMQFLKHGYSLAASSHQNLRELAQWFQGIDH